MKMTIRRYAQYVAGLLLMALAVVLTRRAELGLTPFSTVPAALTNVTGLSLGTTTVLLHVACVLGQIAVRRRVTLKTLLTLPIALPFGMVIDGLMLLIDPGSMSAVQRGLMCLAGLLVNALGIVCIVGADLMLPAPDALIHTVSDVAGRPLHKVKVCGDLCWVVMAGALELVCLHRIAAVGLGTLAAAAVTGTLVGLLSRGFPRLNMAGANI